MYTTNKRVTKKLFIAHYKRANDKIIYKKSWDGVPQLKDKLVRLTLAYKEASLKLKAECGEDDIIHNTIATMNGNIESLRGVESINSSVLVGVKLTTLTNFSSILINKYNICAYLVHRTKDELLK